LRGLAGLQIFQADELWRACCSGTNSGWRRGGHPRSTPVRGARNGYLKQYRSFRKTCVAPEFSRSSRTRGAAKATPLVEIAKPGMAGGLCRVVFPVYSAA
jgi:hypothetical protein